MNDDLLYIKETPDEEYGKRYELRGGGDTLISIFIFRHNAEEWLESVRAHTQYVIKVADLKATIEAAEQIWSVYQAPSRDGGKMVDFDKWLPGQIEDWKKQLAKVENTVRLEI